MERASDAIISCRDFETISQALRAPGRTLQHWGLLHVPQSPFDAADPWDELLPQVRRLATCEREEIRGTAIECLKDIEGQQEFLTKSVRRCSLATAGSAPRSTRPHRGADFSGPLVAGSIAHRAVFYDLGTGACEARCPTSAARRQRKQAGRDIRCRKAEAA